MLCIERLKLSDNNILGQIYIITCTFDAYKRIYQTYVSNVYSGFEIDIFEGYFKGY